LFTQRLQVTDADKCQTTLPINKFTIREKLGKDVSSHLFSGYVSEHGPLLDNNLGVQHCQANAVRATEVSHRRVLARVAYLHHGNIVTVELQRMR